MNIAIVKYNAGNIQSVIHALNRLGIDPILTDNAEELQAADKVIFPGVGEASTAMQYLKNAGLDQVIPHLTNPVLGICVGLQLMCAHSEEGDTEGLGIFPLKVKKFEAIEDFKVPHMGWNKLEQTQTHLFDQLHGLDSYVYYVHSYYCELGEDTVASTTYVNQYSAALHKGNFYAVQFHPEKSGHAGHQLLENFIKLC